MPTHYLEIRGNGFYYVVPFCSWNLPSFYMLGDFSADFFLQNKTHSKISFGKIIRVSNTVDPDQARHFVGPDLGPSCF